ncbi:hydroxyquinol 1,2-dioxygenase [Cupriavidus sp. CP313]
MKLLTKAIVASTIALTLGAATTVAHAMQGDYPYEKNAHIAGARGPHAYAGRTVTDKRDPFVDGARSVTDRRDPFSDGARSITEPRSAFADGT